MLPAYITATGTEDKDRPQSCNNQNIMAPQKCSFKPNIRQRLHTSTWPIHTNGQKHRSGTIKELNRPSHTDIQKEPLKMYWLFRLEHVFSAACHPNWVNIPPSSLVFSLPLFLSPSLPPFLSPSHPFSSYRDLKALFSAWEYLPCNRARACNKNSYRSQNRHLVRYTDLIMNDWKASWIIWIFHCLPEKGTLEFYVNKDDYIFFFIWQLLSSKASNDLIGEELTMTNPKG